MQSQFGTLTHVGFCAPLCINCEPASTFTTGANSHCKHTCHLVDEDTQGLNSGANSLRARHLKYARLMIFISVDLGTHC